MNRLLLAVFAACLAFGALPSSLYGVDDTTPPTLTVPGDITTPATSAAGATVTFTATATDDVDPSPVVACNPSSGSTFVIGTTAVNCTATDAANNQSQGSFNVTVSPFAAPPGDTTDPTLSLPSDITAPATTSAGATVSFTVTATDDTDPNPVVACNPSSGSTFAIGTTPVGCTATDASNNQAHGSFNVTVTPLAPPPDTAGPVFSGVPGTITVQANGPGGSVVNYVQPTASDDVDGPALVTCTPTSGSLFPLGTTTVNCSASDNHGNSNGASFAVVVADKTPPTLIVPIDSAAYAESPTGLSAGGYGLRQFLAAAHASDLVDPRPRISNDAGEFLTVGVHTITFSAVDASGNAVSAAAVFEVRPQPPSGTPPLPLPPERKAPPDVTGFKAIAGDARVQLSWKIPTGVDHVLITRVPAAGGTPTQIYGGSGTSFVDREVANGIEYRYVITSVDQNGESSAGVAAVALPKRNLLRSPKDGAKLTKPPKLTWAKNSEAAYYNVQLFRGKVKILSMWPVRPAVSLRRSWKFQGRHYTLGRGTYRWYVWPGFGKRAAVDYGEMLGARSFQITR